MLCARCKGSTGGKKTACGPVWPEKQSWEEHAL